MESNKAKLLPELRTETERSNIMITPVPRTNCNNCGAPLVNGKCQYCKTTWFTESKPVSKIPDGFIEITTCADSAPVYMRGLSDAWDSENSREWKK